MRASRAVPNTSSSIASRSRVGSPPITPPGRAASAVLMTISTRPPNSAANSRTLRSSVRSSGTGSAPSGTAACPIAARGVQVPASPANTSRAPAASARAAIAVPSAPRVSVTSTRRSRNEHPCACTSTSSPEKFSGSASMTAWPALSSRNTRRTRVPGSTSSCRNATARGPASMPHEFLPAPAGAGGNTRRRLPAARCAPAPSRHPARLARQARRGTRRTRPGPDRKQRRTRRRPAARTAPGPPSSRASVAPRLGPAGGSNGSRVTASGFFFGRVGIFMPSAPRRRCTGPCRS